MAKWIDIVDTERPATSVAAEILAARAEVVRQYLPLAAKQWRDDIEHVHQLRVACRRTGAALRSFRPLAQKKSTRRSTKELRHWLRRLRQAAGPARDADVLIERLQAEESSIVAERSITDTILQRLDQHRTEVQTNLRHVAKQAKKEGFADVIDTCVNALQKQSGKSRQITFHDFAHRALQATSQQMLDRAQIASPTISQLHELRIAGKRLRYSIELFQSVFSDELRESLYPLVEKIQSRLGKLNDHATAQSLFQQWLGQMPADEHAAQLAQRIVAEHRAAQKLREEFLDWWTPRQIAAFEKRINELVLLDD